MKTLNAAAHCFTLEALDGSMDHCCIASGAERARNETAARHSMRILIEERKASLWMRFIFNKIIFKTRVVFVEKDRATKLNVKPPLSKAVTSIICFTLKWQALFFFHDFSGKVVPSCLPYLMNLCLKNALECNFIARWMKIHENCPKKREQ